MDTELEPKDTVKIVPDLKKLLRKINKREMKFGVITSTLSIIKGCIRPSEGWGQVRCLFTNSILSKRRVRIRHLGEWKDTQ